jgi:hypothetical protein
VPLGFGVCVGDSLALLSSSRLMVVIELWEVSSIHKSAISSVIEVSSESDFFFFYTHVELVAFGEALGRALTGLGGNSPLWIRLFVGDEGLDSNSVEIDDGDGARESRSLMLSSMAVNESEVDDDAQSKYSLLNASAMADPSKESASSAELCFLLFQ